MAVARCADRKGGWDEVGVTGLAKQPQTDLVGRASRDSKLCEW